MELQNYAKLTQFVLSTVQRSHCRNFYANLHRFVLNMAPGLLSSSGTIEDRGALTGINEKGSLAHDLTGLSFESHARELCL